MHANSHSLFSAISMTLTRFLSTQHTAVCLIHVRVLHANVSVYAYAETICVSGSRPISCPDPDRTWITEILWPDSDRLDFIYPIRTGSKIFIINPKLPGFGLLQTCEYDQKFQNSQEKYDTLLKNTTTPTQMKSLSPTRPENILKKCPDRKLMSVQYSPIRGNSGFWVAPQVFNCSSCRLHPWTAIITIVAVICWKFDAKCYCCHVMCNT